MVLTSRHRIKNSLALALRLLMAVVAISLVGARIAMATELCCDDVQCLADCDDDSGPCHGDCTDCQCGHSGVAFLLGLAETAIAVHPPAEPSESLTYVARHPPERTTPGVFHPPKARAS